MVIFARLRHRVLQFSRPTKRFLVLFADVLVCLVSTWIAFALRLDIWFDFSGEEWKVFVIAVTISFPIFIYYGLYRAIFRFAGWSGLFAVGRALVFFFIVMLSIFTVYGVDGVPRSIGILQPIFFIFGIGLNRAIICYVLRDDIDSSRAFEARRVLIIGVKLQARELAVKFLKSPDKLIVGFIDEDSVLGGNTINGIPVFSAASLEKILEKDQIQELHLVCDKLSQQRRSYILKLLEGYPYIRFINHIAQDMKPYFVTDSALIDFNIDDLLARSQVMVDEVSIRLCMKNHVILVTGAGGSIGSEICRQILNHEPKTLLLIENSEPALYKIYEELNGLSNVKNLIVNIVPAIASVSDEGRMKELIFSWRPDMIFHAAAFKHVPLVESNPAEAILNNVQGTLICASLAIEAGVSRFVLVSTDKAVRPTNIMGASKRLAEMLLQAMTDQQMRNKRNSILSIVRFGNVLGSSGSVVLLFSQQIAFGGPITITHPEVTRYFMSIPEASRLVLQASILGKGGEVFLLEMGQPIRIIDLAKRMILLSGNSLKDHINPNGDIQIQITGLRPGEKLHEELLIGANPMITDHPKIMRAMENFLPWSVLEPKLMRLFEYCKYGNVSEIKLTLSKLVDGYEPHPNIVDLTYLERVLAN